VTPTDAADALADHLARRYGGPVRLVAPPTANGEGFDSDIYFMQFSGPTLPDEWGDPIVLRVKGRVDQLHIARREVEIQDWLAERAYPVPRILALFEPGELLDAPVQAMERAPGVTMLQNVVSAPWSARRRMAQLAALHTRLHAIDPTGFPIDDDLLDRRLQLVRRTADELDDADLRDGLVQVGRIADRLRAAEATVCHGDFHPLNVIVSADDAAVIDWTDAGVGDRHGDVARTLLLFDLAAVAASRPLERIALRAVGPLLGRWYRRSYAASRPLDDVRIAMWRPVHLLHGWSQVRGLHAGQFDGDIDGDEARPAPAVRVAPGLADELRRRFEVAMAAIR
jgi:aminoglycoside phosphotransferase (APT) family kinase protein